MDPMAGVPRCVHDVDEPPGYLIQLIIAGEQRILRGGDRDIQIPGGGDDHGPVIR